MKKTFNEIAKDICDLHEKKNADYGNSFSKTFKELGIISAVTRLNDKMNRVKSLAVNGTRKVNDESIIDTLMDLAAYSIMTIEELQEYK